MTYDEFRHAADSWGLLYLVIIFVAVLAYTFRPGGRKSADDAANIPLKED
jgi:cytochrome c oxidase cbb3-type subunit 4